MKRLGFVALVCIGSLYSCSNDKLDLLYVPQPCNERFESDVCGDDYVYRKGICDQSRCDADPNFDNCCPGQQCSSTGLCTINTSYITTCESNGDCPWGQVCYERPLVSKDVKTCGHATLDSEGTCENPLRPFAGRCVLNAPCNGFCSPGEVCNIDLNVCESVPYIKQQYQHGCDQECQVGELLVYENPDSMLFDKCCQVTCRCATLPDLLPGVFGRYADIALAENTIYVSSYDDTYGDVVVAEFSKDNGSFQSLTYVDGVPSVGTYGGNPDGLRNGITDLGEDVGKYTSIAMQLDQPHMVYYDEENGNLKYASYNAGTETWSIHVVDDGNGDSYQTDGDVGRYAELVIREDLIPRVVYMMKYGYIEDVNYGLPVTALVYAEAINTNPQNAGQWIKHYIDVMPVPVEPCLGSCPDGYSCVEDSTEDTACQENASYCYPACESGEICVRVDGSTTCRVHTPIFLAQGIVKGTGLYPNLVFQGGRPITIFYDSIIGALKGSEAHLSGNYVEYFAAPTILDGGSDEDCGRFADAYYSQTGQLGISYMDVTKGELKFYSGFSLNDGVIEVADNGARDQGKHRVGPDSNVFLHEDGTPVIIYQDATSLDISIVKKVGGTWQRYFSSPCGDLCRNGDVCVAGDDFRPECQLALNEKSCGDDGCDEGYLCVQSKETGVKECRLQKEQIANGFFLSVIYDHEKVYAADLEIAFDMFERRANILGVRILNATAW